MKRVKWFEGVERWALGVRVGGLKGEGKARIKPPLCLAVPGDPSTLSPSVAMVRLALRRRRGKNSEADVKVLIYVNVFPGKQR